MHSSPEKTDPKRTSKPRNVLIVFLLIAIMLCFVWMMSDVQKEVEVRQNLVNGWVDVYSHARGNPAEVMYSQRSTMDCMRTLDILERREFFIELDSMVVKSDTMETACAKKDLHKLVFWR